VLRQERAREHHTALRSRPSLGHQRPGALAQRKTRGPPRRPTTQPRRHRAVLDRKAGTEAAHLRLQQHHCHYHKNIRRTYLKPPRAAAFFCRSCRVVCACRSRRCGGAKWANGPAFSLAPTRVAPVVLGQRLEAWHGSHGTTKTAAVRTRRQTKHRKSKRHLRVHRTALRPRLPRPCCRTGPAATKTAAVGACHMSFETAENLDSASIRKTLAECRSAGSQVRQS